MDGQQYLNQISQSNRPAKNTGGGGLKKILSSKFFIVGAVGLGILVLILILGGLLSGGKGDEKSLNYKLFLHLDNTLAVVQTYQPEVKSSILRSSSASLQGVLSNTKGKLEGYLGEKYKFKAKDIDKATTAAATKAKDELTKELFEAKINGVLDRTYAHRMAYEIDAIASEEAKIIKSASNDTLKGILTESYDSLTTLYEKFNDFSETKGS